MRSKTIFWVFVFSGIIALCVLVMVKNKDRQGQAALIYQGEELLYRIELDEISDAYVILIECQEGTNTVLVEPGRISVIEATCRDRVCVRHAPLPGSSTPIVCLPHQLFITMEDK